MKIGIEALGIQDFGGGRSATMNLLQNLLAIDRRNQYTIFLTCHEPALLARNVQQIILPIENRFLARLFLQVYLPLKSRQLDLIHFAKNLACFGMTKPFVMTLFDMTTLLHPELMPKIDVWYWQHIQPHTVVRAQKVIAISKTTREEIRKIYGPGTENIEVIYPTIHPRFQPRSLAECAQILKRYRLPQSYILHVGRLDRKNNISLVIAAFAEFVHVLSPGYDGKLVIVGGNYAKSQDTNLRPLVRLHGLQNRILFTGRVPDEDLSAIYSAAQVAVMASKHEGFGLAAVEAMACGTPLIANRVGAIPEVVGEAAIFVDHIDKDQLAQAFRAVLSDRPLREELRQRGLERARKYQTRRDAEQTVKCYKSIFQEAGLPVC